MPLAARAFFSVALLSVSGFAAMVKGQGAPRSKHSKAESSSKSAESNILPLDASLFERLDGQEAKSQTPQKRKRVRNLDETLAKVLRDNFPMFKLGQSTMLVNAEGKTLVEVLREDRIKVLAKDKDAPKCGKHYYDSLKRDFSYSDAPFKKLKVKDEGEQIDEALMQALIHVNTCPRNFNNAIDLLETGPRMNQKSTVLLFKQALQISVSAGSDALAFLLGVIKYTSRHNIPVVYKEEWMQIKDHLDSALVKSLSTWKANSNRAKLWWESHRAWIASIIPVADADKCLLCVDDYQNVEQELCRVVQSSQIGNKLFGVAHRQYEANKMTQTILKVVGQLVAADVTMEAVRKTRSAFIEASLKNGRDVREMITKRNVQVVYRNVTFPVVVHSHYDEYLMQETAAIETVAVDNGALPPLFCESELVPAARTTTKLKVDEEVLADALAARRAANSALQCEAPSGDEILKLMETNKAQFTQLYRGWRVQVGFWQAVVGIGSERRLRDEIMSCITSGDNEITVVDAIAKMEMLGRGKLVAFCGLALQSQFAVCQTFLQDIKCKRPPRYDGEKDSPFLKKIMDAVGKFLTHQKAAGSNKDAPSQKLRGAEAAKAKLELVRKNKAKGEKLSLSELTDLNVFSWLLTIKEREEVCKLIDAAIADDVVGAASAATATASDAPKLGKKKLQTSAREAVLSLLA
jgi:hypothetical protein